jgi:N-acetylglucosamine-6-sulfatase
MRRAWGWIPGTGMLVVALVVLISHVAPSPASGPRTAAAAAAAANAPNFLFILVDDQARSSFKRRYMPQTFRRLVDRGTRFTNALAAPPLCCPDRAGILTGQYPHNHGVFSNHPGYPDLTDPGNTLPVWLRRAGYRTGLFGRFLNRYTLSQGLTPAPGFDRWFQLLEGPGSHYYGYDVSDDGTQRHFSHRRPDYSTDVLTRKALGFLRQGGAGSGPSFAWLAYNAPHVTKLDSGPCKGRNPTPPGRAAYRRFEHLRLPRPHSFNERDVSDKPLEIRSQRRMRRADIHEVKVRWRCALAAMREVDVEIGRMMRALRREHELRRTIVVYASDNGFFFGEHRLREGKGFVYEPALRVPFVVRVPPAYRTGALSRRVQKVVSNQDIAPTLLGYAGASPCAGPTDCRRMDGRDLAPLLGSPGGWPRGRGVLVEIDSRETSKEAHPECHCAYAAIRTRRYAYSELSTGERELYDLRRDPQELWNRQGRPGYAETERTLANRLDELRDCSGVRGRDPPTAAPVCE